MSNTQVKLSIEGPVARITFHTEGGLNVASLDVLDRLDQALARIRGALGVRCVVVGAEGKVFVAGADIREMQPFTPVEAMNLSRRGHAVLDALADLPAVSIARLHGAALGGGFELALACDFRLALAGIKVGLPETTLGLIPGWRGITRSAALGGAAAARRLVFSGQPLEARAAQDLGLIDEVFEQEDQLDTALHELIGRLQRGGPLAIAAAKQVLRGADEAKVFGELFERGECREGLNAFLEKRPASWMGK